MLLLSGSPCSAFQNTAPQLPPSFLMLPQVGRLYYPWTNNYVIIELSP